MARGPTSERPVGGSPLHSASVVLPPKRHFRAYAAPPPDALVLATGRAAVRLGDGRSKDTIATRLNDDVRGRLDDCDRRIPCVRCPLPGTRLE
jgi:hypothetical protein